jgi:predicted transcriptional regulator
MIFLPIRPIYAFAIRDNEKRVEFRKKPFKKTQIEHCMVYATSPYKKIIGYFKISKICEGTPKNIWKKYNKIGGIKESDYYKYYKDVNTAYAIEIEKFHPLKTPINPTKKIEGFCIPQSFRYLSGKEMQILMPNFSIF